MEIKENGEDMLHCSEGLTAVVDRLDMNNMQDVIWAYKHIDSVYRHSKADFGKIVGMLTMQKGIDFNTGLMILEEIGNVMHACFGKNVIDEEIMFVIDKCGVDLGDRGNMPLEWCADYVYKLVLPLSRLFTKQVVDIVAFLFTRTTVAQFDDLFEIFTGKKDVLAELHLLKVRLMRERSAKYICTKCRAQRMESDAIEDYIKALKISGNNTATNVENDVMRVNESEIESDKEQIVRTDFYAMDEFERCKSMSVEKQPDGLELCQDRPFSEDSHEESSSKVEDAQECLSDCKQTIVNDFKDSLELTSHGSGTLIVNAECKCKAYDQSEERRCLDEAKKYLLEIELASAKFFIENAALYLAFTFDKDLLDMFSKYINTEYRGVCAMNLFRMKTVEASVLEQMVCKMSDMRKEILMAESLVVSLATAKMYVAWCAETFESISTQSMNDYLEISKLYARFLRVFRHRKMFFVFDGICGSRVERISSSVGKHLANDLKEIIEMILSLYESNNEIDDGVDKLKSCIIIDDEQCEGVVNGACASDDLNCNVAHQEAHCSKCNENNEEEIIFEGIKCNEASEAFVRDKLKERILEICKCDKKVFLSQIGVIENFDEEFRTRVIKVLCSNYDEDWRYRRALLHCCKMHPLIFKDSGIVELFAKDRVFAVRRTALDMKQEEDEVEARRVSAIQEQSEKL
ncbi:hypothetical protein M896_051670 [Ordospora colligata OC4]|uniref:Uncharacterized protein n=1 Tax=Ordospora colligata OC4 TaxID=1354746 RepID=A0A0B2UKC6_9MICR|nr:uncharacterized protein M896_051670 [Ordospora colligata OC4]KHN69758.1 hypothetical protein M896_051670 [Ordospora colligata OC4]